MLSRQVTVGLLWHSLDSANLGVGALTLSQMHLVREAAASVGVDPRFVLIGWNKEGAVEPIAGVQHVCSVSAQRLLGRDPALRQALNLCDLVLDIGEGDSFSDIYGWRRLVFLIGTKLLAARGGRPLVLSPQTLGPFKGRFAAWCADMAMRRAALVCTRDALSSAYYTGRRLPTPLLEATDVAFALPFTPEPRGSGGRPRVGLNVSGLLWAGGYTGANQFGLKLDYRQTVLDLVDWFTGPGGAEVVLVPHVVTPDREAEDDWRASQQVAAQRPSVQLAGTFQTPVDAKSFISGLDFFVGARMHACIAAFSSGVPCVAMAYSRKFTGLFNTVGYPHVADCTAADAAAVLGQVRQAYEQRGALQSQVQAGQQAAAQRLACYRDALASLLQQRARRG